MSEWFGKNCEYQICQYEGWYTQDGYEEDKSEPILIYCNHKNNIKDCEGNCRKNLCPINKILK